LINGIQNIANNDGTVDPAAALDVTTFNCLVSTVYNPVHVTDTMVPDIIKNLQESHSRRVKIFSIDTEQVSGLRYVALKYVVFEKRLPMQSDKMYARINHVIVLGIDPFPSKFPNHNIVNWADKPNPKKTREEQEEEEYEEYSLTNDMQRSTETDPDLIKEYEALDL
uniref:Uncharacterized protein n=1 Tax=Romanomermis culicivorax TaxID=13658 RepID=A0A915JJ37_ROMCU